MGGGDHLSRGGFFGDLRVRDKMEEGKDRLGLFLEEGFFGGGLEGWERVGLHREVFGVFWLVFGCWVFFFG